MCPEQGHVGIFIEKNPLFYSTITTFEDIPFFDFVYTRTSVGLILTEFLLLTFLVVIYNALY